MRIIGCDLHTRQQTLAMLDTETGEVVRKTLTSDGDNVREFYSTLPRPVRVGIEATGSVQWFVNLTEELGIECRVGNPAKIRAAEPRKQKHDRRDADLILTLLAENRSPASRNKNSGFYRALHVSYPNSVDRERARKLGVDPGGNIMVHGIKNGLGWLGSMHRVMDWTDGCIAVSDTEMDEIWSLVPDGTPI